MTPGPSTSVVVFVTTGRCGTQWLAANLTKLYPDGAVVTHEPIGPHYRCREFFRAYDRLSEMAAVPAIGEHLDEVAQIVDRAAYVETGWPVFSAVPLFIERFGGRVRLVHLTRHPVPTAISHMVHQTYGGSPRIDGYTQLAALDACCPGVYQTELAERWDELTPYEKTLFWWTEVHLYADELRERYPSVPFHRVKAESLLGGESGALADLCSFMGLPFRDELAHRTAERVDEWPHRTDIEFDWRLIHRHPRAAEVAARLGYDVTDVDAEGLAQRYRRVAR